MDSDTRIREGVAVTRLSLVVNVVLALAKCGAGVAANSHALVADGIHSVVDSGSDIATLVGFRLAAKPGDEDHPYGHHRFVTLVTLGVSLSVLTFCVTLAWDSLRRLGANEPATVTPGILPIVVAATALVVKETFYRFATRQAKRLKSRALLANAMDHRADSMASLVALIALLSVKIGGPAWSATDAVAGLLLAGWLGSEALKLVRQSLADLTDTAPADDVMSDLAEHILPVAGVRGFHAFRARRVGDMIEIDFHLQVCGDISVDAGHDIAGKVKAELMSRHPEVLDALIHLEPDSPHHLRRSECGRAAVKRDA